MAPHAYGHLTLRLRIDVVRRKAMPAQSESTPQPPAPPATVCLATTGPGLEWCWLSPVRCACVGGRGCGVAGDDHLSIGRSPDRCKPVVHRHMCRLRGLHEDAGWRRAEQQTESPDP